MLGRWGVEQVAGIPHLLPSAFSNCALGHAGTTAHRKSTVQKQKPVRMTAHPAPKGETLGSEGSYWAAVPRDI